MKTVFICPLTGYTFREEGNGILDIRKANGEWVLGLGKNTQAALAKHFRDKEDERLGRWRWPENPDYVVYPLPSGEVKVLRESQLESYSDGPAIEKPISRDAVEKWSKGWATNFYEAARAYFAAHPLQKPWHNAKEGEVWEITTTFYNNEKSTHVVKFEDGYFRYNDGTYDGAKSPLITAGKRIWGKD